MSRCSFGPAALAAVCSLVFLVPLSPAAEKGKLANKTYPVSDLVIPIPGLGAEAKTNEPADRTPPPTCQDQLIQLIVQTIQPASWQQNGGSGTIDYFPLTMALVINQTPDIHEQVAELLAALRRMQETEVAVEVKVLSTSDECFERIGVDFNAIPTPETGPRSAVPVEPRVERVGDEIPKDLGLAFLSDQQVKKLLETAQGDTRTNIMQAPRLILLNGQKGTLNLTDTQHYLTGLEVGLTEGGKVVFRPKNEPTCTGFRMTSRPIVSADRRSVQLALKVEQTDLASSAVPAVPIMVSVKDDKGKTVPFTQFLQQPRVNTLTLEKTVTIPDGATAVFGGLKKVSEVRDEYGPPVLSKVPYVNRLFKNVGYSRESQQVFVMVTPRVIVNEEETRGKPVVRGQSAPGFAEEQETPARAAKPRCPEKALTQLLRAYDSACAQGRPEEAEKLARAALAIDPTCFRRKP